MTALEGIEFPTNFAVDHVKFFLHETFPDPVRTVYSPEYQITATGWAPRIAIEEGVSMAYQSFLEEHAAGTLRE